jgi:hypothetical protein
MEEKELLNAGPVFSVSEQDEGIDWVNFEKDVGQAFQTGKVLCRSEAWSVPPGAMIECTDPGMDEGTWLVYDVECDLLHISCEITINAPIEALPEPAPQYEDIPAARNKKGELEQKGKTGTEAKGLVKFDGHPVAAWIVPILQWARLHGWQGVVNSGYRTASEQLSAASNYAAQLGKSVSEIYPDGPLASNHCKINYPGGAVDVTDPEQLYVVLKKYTGSPNLVWAQFTIEDGVHFSSDGH